MIYGLFFKFIKCLIFLDKSYQNWEEIISLIIIISIYNALSSSTSLGSSLFSYTFIEKDLSHNIYAVNDNSDICPLKKKDGPGVIFCLHVIGNMPHQVFNDQ